MKAKLNIVYAPDLNGIEFGTPVVHYADACAAIEKLEADLELKEALLKNAKHRFDEMAQQLEHMALLADSLQSKPKLTVHASGNCGHSLPRWDGPAKVL